jgi:aspartyl-tRNA(Asn)/glutamyl-tRNA(Gln) amidotransferase subunit B
MKEELLQHWEPIIGLEIHTELNTRSKLFASSPNHFGDEPNSNISPVCLGLPGTLPVVNKEAVRKAVQFGLAIGAKISTFSQFDRKSYFYPDSPRNFQITQFEHPIIIGGSITCAFDGEEKIFRVNRAHIEDDAGMLKHFSAFAGVDYNRAGVPLLEIVSEPCMHSPKEASSYASAIKAILEALDASDCNMEEGSLRVDVNISVRKKGEVGFRNKSEIKNMNSFSNLEKALNYEIERQIREYEKHPDKNPLDVIHQATYRFDPETGKTILMRRKEGSEDYRYFPEPDLPPLVIVEEFIEEIRRTLPELPLVKERRYVSTLGLAPHAAFAIAYDKKLSLYFEESLTICTNPKALANWLIVEFAGRLKEHNLDIYETPIAPQHVATLVNLIERGTVSGKIAKSIADDMVASPGKDPQTIIDQNPHYTPITNALEIMPIIEEVISSNMQSVEDFLAGRDRAFAFLVGQVMKRTKGAASPQVVNDLLKKKIAELKK